MTNDQRVKVVTRTTFTDSSLPGNPSRDTRWLTLEELSSYLRAIQTDSDEFGTYATVNVDGQPYAIAERHWQGLSRCPACLVKHLRRCLSAPDQSTCQHQFTVVTALPNKLMGAIHSWTAYRQCALCDQYRPESAFES